MPHHRSAAEVCEKLTTRIFANSAEATKELAKEVQKLIIKNSSLRKPVVLGLATGSTPVPFYLELIRMHQEEGLSFKDVITFNLDEYHGLNSGHPESYAKFMADQLFDHIDIPK
ncbi:MAG: glucosamine-6-phosphate deaminase, partial [Verrucomicrobiota bacterium]